MCIQYDTQRMARHKKPPYMVNDEASLNIDAVPEKSLLIMINYG
ncbi:hypothetical protein XIS1_1030020 [Xenorhabdus innexi]|uniref:Uncharacterized protein n=1 Tax=Xenorhabdus innexi TaxID=290109 RepID=A0A1N6MQF8_9GAMM|nr:hypothetical protein XIS1_1030020 [Xenorhabdus innexi]